MDKMHVKFSKGEAQLNCGLCYIYVWMVSCFFVFLFVLPVN